MIKAMYDMMITKNIEEVSLSGMSGKQKIRLEKSLKLNFVGIDVISETDIPDSFKRALSRKLQIQWKDGGG